MGEDCAGGWHLTWAYRDEEGFSRLRSWKSLHRHRKRQGQERRGVKMSSANGDSCRESEVPGTVGWAQCRMRQIKHRESKIQNRSSAPCLDSTIAYTC